ncbi:outer dense fiber protein 4 isoform X2 [Talpa occidentalis]|uniref:outer dense fiber protein 4 isoform X2 n=1 Tax=Talpa occidentalis TaxID=50954 RepID=UPI0023F63382|nr:outer dense fiber protein 4 isoform X2 [Talpa occidentalis]
MSSLGQEETGMSISDLESQEGVGEQDRAEVSLEEQYEKHYSVPDSANARQMSREGQRDSLLSLQWKMKHSSRWIAQALASELSLIAFILLLVMLFSKKWLYLSGSRYYQRWPMNVSTTIYTSAQIMSMGLLHISISNRCPCSENGKVTFIFSTLMLFPINLWIFELKKNLSIPIGWSYFIGWLVFTLYVTCGILCYFNYKHFWSLIQIHPSDTDSESISSNYSESHTEQITSNILNVSVNQEEVLDPGQRKSSLDSESEKAFSEPLDSESKKAFSEPLDSESKKAFSEPLDSESKKAFSEPLDSESKNKFTELPTPNSDHSPESPSSSIPTALE